MCCLLGAIAYKKLTNTVLHKMFSIAEVKTKAINCSSANKSCLLQVVHTKAIADLTQFCDFLCNSLHPYELQIHSMCIRLGLATSGPIAGPQAIVSFSKK